MLSDHLHLGIVAAALSADPRQSARLARAAGFDGLLFDLALGGVDLTELSASGRREFRGVLSGQNEQLVGLRADAGTHGLGPGADVDRVLHRLDRAMETAAGLQSPLVCVDLGQLPAPSEPVKPKPAVTPDMAGLILLPASATAAPPPPGESPPPPDPAVAAQIDGALAELGRRADRYGVTLALRSDLSGFAALDRAIRAAACPWFGVDMDPVAVLRDAWPTNEVFARLGPLVRHVRGRDATAGADRRTKPAAIAQGGTDWPELLALLDDAGYRGWITIDPTELTDRSRAAAIAKQYFRPTLRS